MKPLLWLLLLAALAVNISSSFLFDGAQQALISVATGLTALASGITLAVRHRKQRATA
ncbi:hypothetical protein [Streptomyces kanamyceticus]|uniref:hypothetical protein n=1 Tax=Streptomyces kanamyceticus TaxID=1967 RepID=UPI000B1D0F00|nr:hypothetical protein [Streptomyces kanamyceticus]